MTRISANVPSPSVPPPASDGHPLRDALLVALLLVPLVAAGIGAFVSRNLQTLAFEKRNANPWPALPSQRSVREFTTAFERAFDDRFGGRDYLARLHRGIEARVFGTTSSPNVMLGRNDWLYWIGEDGKSLDRHHRGVVPLRVPLDAIVGDLLRRHVAMASRGIPSIVAIVPDKFTLYPEHLPAWVRRAPATPLDRLQEALRADGRIRVADVRAALEAAKPDRRLYYLTDSHWNFAGAATGYDAIMREVQHALPGRLRAIAPVRWPPYVRGKDFYSGDLGGFLGVRWFFREDDVAPLGKVLADAASRCAQRVEPSAHLRGLDVEVYECPRAELPRAVAWRDSMAIPLVPIVSENFSRIVWISGRQFDPAIVEAERADVVIQEFVERSMDEMPPFTGR